VARPVSTGSSQDNGAGRLTFSSRVSPPPPLLLPPPAARSQREYGEAYPHVAEGAIPTGLDLGHAAAVGTAGGNALGPLSTVAPGPGPALVSLGGPPAPQPTGHDGPRASIGHQPAAWVRVR
jgi:hypothetical protein